MVFAAALTTAGSDEPLSTAVSSGVVGTGHKRGSVWRVSPFTAFPVSCCSDDVFRFAPRCVLRPQDVRRNGKPEELHQDMKSAYIACSADIIFAAPRFNNHRPYLMAGVSPMINLSSKTSDYLKLKRQTFALEVGMEYDFYLPFFKLRPELKFVYALATRSTQSIRRRFATRTF